MHSNENFEKNLKMGIRGKYKNLKLNHNKYLQVSFWTLADFSFFFFFFFFVNLYS